MKPIESPKTQKDWVLRLAETQLIENDFPGKSKVVMEIFCFGENRADSLTLIGREWEREREMAAITSAVIAIAGVVLGWIAIEIACKPCLEKGRESIDRSLNPDYDPDDDNINTSIRAPLNPAPDLESKADTDTSSSTSIKAV